MLTRHERVFPKISIIGRKRRRRKTGANYTTKKGNKIKSIVRYLTLNQQKTLTIPTVGRILTNFWRMYKSEQLHPL